MLFDALFVVLCLLCAVLYWLQRRYNRSKVSVATASREFRLFQTSYLVAYALAVTGPDLPSLSPRPAYSHRCLSFHDPPPFRTAPCCLGILRTGFQC